MDDLFYKQDNSLIFFINSIGVNLIKIINKTQFYITIFIL